MAKAKGRPVGQMIERPEGSKTWLLRVTIMVNGQRRTRNKTVRDKTRTEAAIELGKFLQEVGQNKHIDPQRKRLRDVAEEWFNRLSSSREPTTVQRYRQILDSYILPDLGETPLQKLTRPVLKDFYARMQTRRSKKTGRTLSASSIRMIHNCLHGALEDAVDSNYLAANPASRIKNLPRVRQAEVRFLNEEEAVTLLHAAQGSPYHLPLGVGMALALRRGEVLGLRWQDLDTVSRTITIRQQVVRLTGKGAVVKEPKSDDSNRSIEVPEAILDLLAKHRKEQNQQRLLAGPKWHNNDLIFCKPDGTPRNPGKFNKALGRVFKRAGLEHLGTHATMRHTGAAWLVKENVHIRVIQELLGHKNISVTQRYAHLSPGQKREAVAGNVSKLFGQGKHRNGSA